MSVLSSVPSQAPVPDGLPPRHFLVDTDLSSAEQLAILDDSDRRKRERRHRSGEDRPLADRSVALIFEKPSTRTRISFEVGVAELGAHPVVIDAAGSQIGRGETLADTAAVLSRYVDAIVVRTFGQDRIEELAASASVPVVNALTDFAHPCQALADLQTIRERKQRLSGLTLAYVGDGNNMAHSLMLAGSMAGLRVHVASPPGFEPLDQVVRHANEIGEASGGEALVLHDPTEAVGDADVIYTDVWASMGQEAESSSRGLVFSRYQVDERLVAAAKPDAIVLHCLPAHRGEEIAGSVIDGPQSAVFDQAENRLHAQKALLAHLLAGPGSTSGARSAPGG
jgi:ornithine carbamoyltransferase